MWLCVVALMAAGTCARKAPIHSGSRAGFYVYYLSPQILRRAALPAHELMDPTYRLAKELVTPAVSSELLRALDIGGPVEGWRLVERAGYLHDYRLCIDDGTRVRWFSGNARVVLEDGRVYRPSGGELLAVQRLFQELDRAVGRTSAQDPE